MTQSEIQTKPDVAPTPADASSASARQAMSNFAVEVMRSATTGGASSASDQTTPESAAKAAKVAAEVGSAAEAIGSILNDKFDRREGGCLEKARLVPDTDFKVSDEDRKKAKEVLASELSDLIPAEDRKLMMSLQAAVIDGNLEQLKETLNKLSGDPAKLDKFIKALNKQLDGHEKFNAIDLARDSAGNVLLYKQNGSSTALQINPRTGEATVRAIEVQKDGSVLLKPGEIINMQPSDVMKSVGDEAARAVVGPRYNVVNWCAPPNYDYRMPEYLPQYLPGSVPKSVPK